MNWGFLGLAMTMWGSSVVGGILSHYGLVDGVSDAPVAAQNAWLIGCAVSGLGIGISTWRFK